MDFASIRVRSVANYRHQQRYCHQLQNTYRVDTLDDSVVNLIFALKAGAANDFGLDRIGSGRPWFCLLHYCWENLSKLVYWEISTINLSLRIIYRVVQYQLSISELPTENHLLKIIILVFKIVFSLLPTPNAFKVNILGDSTTKENSKIPVVNCKSLIFVLFPSLLKSLIIIGMLRSWRLYYLRFGFSIHQLRVFYLLALDTGLGRGDVGWLKALKTVLVHILNSSPRP